MFSSVLTLAAVLYDYVLTFSEEIEYIWMKPWTLVTALFIVVRYAGICCIIATSMVGSSFLSGPSVLCGIIYTISIWAHILFIGAAELAVILRVWVLYSQSRRILFTLLLLFSVEIIVTIIDTITTTPSNIHDIVISTVQTLHSSVCPLTYPSTITGKVAGIFQFANISALCAFTFLQFVIQSLEMYRVTKRWELNRYINLMVKQGLIYFVLLCSYSLIAFLQHAGALPTEGSLFMASIIVTVPTFALTPRFIISIRELHASKLRGARGSGIDTGFGLSTLSDHGGAGAAESGVVFVDVERNHWQGPGDEIEVVVQVEDSEDETTQEHC